MDHLFRWVSRRVVVALLVATALMSSHKVAYAQNSFPDCANSNVWNATCEYKQDAYTYAKAAADVYFAQINTRGDIKMCGPYVGPSYRLGVNQVGWGATWIGNPCSQDFIIGARTWYYDRPPTTTKNNVHASCDCDEKAGG